MMTLRTDDLTKVAYVDLTVKDKDGNVKTDFAEGFKYTLSTIYRGKCVADDECIVVPANEFDYVINAIKKLETYDSEYNELMFSEDEIESKKYDVTVNNDVCDVGFEDALVMLNDYALGTNGEEEELPIEFVECFVRNYEEDDTYEDEDTSLYVKDYWDLDMYKDAIKSGCPYVLVGRETDGTDRLYIKELNNIADVADILIH